MSKLFVKLMKYDLSSCRCFFLLLILFQSFIVKANDPGSILSDIKKLNTFANVLYIAAHPDDENTRLLSYLANEKCFRTAYLSITRGDGGQNLIGIEQGDDLGIIRTQELLAARRTDGAEQFFTRAVDFGFSKNPEETFKIWGKDAVLADVVWVIRNFKPDVIITRFPENGGGGHGHHTASAILAREAFKAAADKNRFKDQLQYVDVWQTKSLFWNTFSLNRMTEEETKDLLTMDIGAYNPLLGKSYGEIASLSRSQHKSQGFGVANGRGEIMEYFMQWEGEPVKKHIFENINSDWSRLAGSEKAASLAQKLQSKFNPEKPAAISKDLILIYAALSQLPDHYFKTQKIDQIKKLLLKVNGLHLEFLAKNPSANPGDTVETSIYLINRSNTNIQLNWLKVNLLKDTLSYHSSLTENNLNEEKIEIVLPEKNAYSNHFWLAKPKKSGLYDVPDQMMVAEPESKALVSAEISINFDGMPVNFQRNAMFKWVDPVKGELKRNFEILPLIEAKDMSELLLFGNQEAKKVRFRLTASKANTNIVLNAAKLAGWSIEPQVQKVSFLHPNQVKEAEFTIKPKADNVNASNLLSFTYTIEGSSEEHRLYGVSRIVYDHIPIQTRVISSELKLVKTDMNASGGLIGYIEGAGDKIPQALERLGYTVEKLDLIKVLNNNLSAYKAIITGIRAYNMNDDLGLMQPFLIDYVDKGGNLIVQYNTKNWISDLKADPMPYEIEISRDRVTDEDAPIKILKPDHPVLNSPNKITSKDFDNWVQERGLYFPSKWDQQFDAIFSMGDPGEAAKESALLVAKYGKGYLLYTGISFFRQLPAGVPGAYRLFENMVELK